MLASLKKYLFDRRTRLIKTFGVISSLYLVRRYVSDRLEEVKDRLEQERLAHHNLKRRFRQTQENTSYTILALIPTLSDQILTGMDVEGLTQELQSMSRVHPVLPKIPPMVPPERPPSSLSSSIYILHDHDAHSDVGSVSVVSPPHSAHYTELAGDNDGDSLPRLGGSTLGLHTRLESSGPPSPDHPNGAHLPVLMSTTNFSYEIGDSASMVGSGLSDTSASDSTTTRTKAELWNEVKMLTFTRTLTTLYSITLLSLLTMIQLTLLARSKYINSVFQLEHDDRLCEQLESRFTLSNLLLRGKDLEELLAGGPTALSKADLDDLEAEKSKRINEEVENEYLTMSWWILHVGWKDVGERVRRGIEEVFQGVSLKTKLAATDVHRLISDVRRRVEYEVTFEGNERRINFLSTLLPSTPEITRHVLTQGGITYHPLSQYNSLTQDESSTSSSQLSDSQYFTSSPALGPSSLQHASSPLSHPHCNPQTHVDPHPYIQETSFTSLLEETRSVICSSDFAHVLEACLDRATKILFNSLEKTIFVTSEPLVVPGDDVRIRFAGLLPGVARWSQVTLNGLPNELVDNLLDMREVECLSAIIFSRFENWLR